MKIYANITCEDGKYLQCIYIDEPESYKSIFQENYVALFHNEADKIYRNILNDVAKASKHLKGPCYCNVCDVYDDNYNSLEQVRQWLIRYDGDW